MLSLYKPKIEDLWFRHMMLADEETMSYNRAWGGTVSFPLEDWVDWHRAWVENRDGKRFYRYLIDGDGPFVGEVAYHFHDEQQNVLADVVIYSKYRGRGYGGQGLELLCRAAKENGVATIYDPIAIGNHAVELFLRHGFTEVIRTDTIVLLKKEL